MSNTRRSTNTFQRDVGGFSGWDRMRSVVLGASDSKSRAIFLALLKLGCRAGELQTLRRKQVDLEFSNNNIMVRSMYVEKQKDKVDVFDDEGKEIWLNGKKKYKYKSKAGYRTFFIRKDEPLSDYFMKCVLVRKNPDDIIFPYTRHQIYYSICNIESTLPPDVPQRYWREYKGEWYPHRLRSERACSLIKDLRYDNVRLARWFGWLSHDMPTRYGNIQALDLVNEDEIKW